MTRQVSPRAAQVVGAFDSAASYTVPAGKSNKLSRAVAMTTGGASRADPLAP